MKWLLMWLNVSVATLNATLQLLVIYRCILQNKREVKIKGGTLFLLTCRSPSNLHSASVAISSSTSSASTTKKCF